MSRACLFAALSALSLSAQFARAQGFGPDTATPALPADSGDAVMIAPQNDGTTQVWSATNPGSGIKPSGSRSVVVTGAPPPGPAGAASTAFQGSNAILSDDDPVTPEAVPDIHLVRRGDTLWDLCNRYYQNPWAWPKVWSYNPQVANPHWIYPGDQLRLTSATGGGQQALSLAPRQTTTIGSGNSLNGRRSQVVSGTVFLRDQGYIGDTKRDVWGELIGSDEE